MEAWIVLVVALFAIFGSIAVISYPHFEVIVVCGQNTPQNHTVTISSFEKNYFSYDEIYCKYETIAELKFGKCTKEFEKTANHGFIETKNSCDEELTKIEGVE